MNRENLWAPWRINYIRGLAEKHECFICNSRNKPHEDKDNFVLWRTQNCIVILNRFPYNNGHLLIAPNRHISNWDQAEEEELLELIKLIRESQKALALAINPHGFNVGVNFGRCAGAGLPEHLHIHVVPRWNGDTNFMNVCGDTEVISQSLSELLELLNQISVKHNLPWL